MKSKLPTTLTLSQLTRLLGMSRQAVDAHVRAGAIVKAGQDAYALDSVPRYIAALRKVAAEGGGSSPERTRLLAARAEREELKLAQLQGQLVHVDHVVEEVSALLVSVKQVLRGLPRKAAPLVHACPDAKAVEVLLLAQVDQALEQLHSTPDDEEDAA
jgi:terminase small subunit / prophage DNA-packing protein